ncbi:MAG: ComF family protein [Vicinamibacterales bacterium]
MLTALRAAADGVLAVVLAPCCAACRRPLESPTRGPVCPACWGALRPITPPICDACGDPLPSWRLTSVELSRCPRCRRGRGALDRGRAVGVYDGALRDILHAFKYDGRRSLAAPLARLMADAGRDLLDTSAVVVPVPLHRGRERSRGFNQARDLASRLGGPLADALTRTRATPSQTDLPAARRHANVRGAFAVRRQSRAQIDNCVVVLVDDVSTTGATLEACARALKEAGAREVRALTAARVVTRRS